MLKTRNISERIGRTTKSERQLLPLCFDAAALDILIVGSGKTGGHAIAYFAGHAPDASITLIAPVITERNRKLLPESTAHRYLERDFTEQDLDGRHFVVVSTDEPAVEERVIRLARARKLPVCVDGDPGNSDFYPGGIGAGRKSLAPLSRQAGYRLYITEDATQSERWKRLAIGISRGFILMVIGYFVFSHLPVRAAAEGTLSWYRTLDPNFHMMLMAGFIAQMIDGALGMGYGVASATILLSSGLNPAAISGSIHAAEIFASGASGISHYKFGNVNMRLFWKLVVPGVLGAIAGALLLVYLGEKYGNMVRPVIAVYTLLLGIRFLTNALRKKPVVRKFRRFIPLAATGGFFDSFGGGGWGPIVTTTLLNGGRSHRFTVGTVSLTEFFVTFSSALTFFSLIGISHWQPIFGLVVGGILAAPFAAMLAGKMPKRTASLLLGLLVIFWSMRIIIKLF